MEEKVNAILMVEILGRPPEHVKKILSEIIDKMAKEKDVEIISRQIAEPKLIEGQENLFTSFAEVEVKTNLRQMLLLIFGYMPSHIDIITPERLSLQNSELNMLLNELTRRLHQYDELARAVLIERQAMAKQLMKQVEEGKITLIEKETGKKSKKEKVKRKTKKLKN